MINKADYDLVGAYSQDEINGLTDALLEKMIDLIDPQHAIKILEAMGGDGNFLLRLFNYSKIGTLNRRIAHYLNYQKYKLNLQEKNYQQKSLMSYAVIY